MKSFLKQYDLTGKPIVSFNINADYGVGSSFQTAKELSPYSIVLECCSAKGGAGRDGMLFVIEGDKEKQVEVEVQNWLRE